MAGHSNYELARYETTALPRISSWPDKENKVKS
jgi:hypothetical protein